MRKMGAVSTWLTTDGRLQNSRLPDAARQDEMR